MCLDKHMETTAPATHCLTIADRRKASRQAKNELRFSREAAEIILAVVGVEITPNLVIKVTLVDVDAKKQGVARRVGPEAFEVTISVAGKAHYEDRHHYVINNSLCHELRHVAQMQADENFAAKYAAASKKVGYGRNPYEVEARFYGRLADHTGTKNTGPAGPAMGELLWAIALG